jgi:hypothetical protein
MNTVRNRGYNWKGFYVDDGTTFPRNASETTKVGTSMWRCVLSCPTPVRADIDLVVMVLTLANVCLPPTSRQVFPLIRCCVALKSEALAYRFTNDQSDTASTANRINMLWKYHGRPNGMLSLRLDEHVAYDILTGMFSTDEHLAGLQPARS